MHLMKYPWDIKYNNSVHLTQKVGAFFLLQSAVFTFLLSSSVLLFGLSDAGRYADKVQIVLLMNQRKGV